MSAETKWTPGPWEVDGILVVNGKEVRADVFPADDDFEAEKICRASIANARLIAAAPRLYEALRTVREEHGYGLPPETLRVIDGALSAARGEA
jgi:hypothetical protein